MSFALPPLISKPTQNETFGLQRRGEFEVSNMMTSGQASARSNLDDVHPLVQSERNYELNSRTMDMAMLRNTQGMHAPLRLAMELKCARKVGHHSFLPSSNAMLDSLTGCDLDFGPADVFDHAEWGEVSRQPHATVEKQLGIL